MTTEKSSKKLKIQKMQQKMDEILHNIAYLEDSKLMQNRFEVSQLRKEFKQVQERYFELKNH